MAIRVYEAFGERFQADSGEGGQALRHIVVAEATNPEFWKDYGSEVALGNIAGRSSVNKFGAAPSGLQTTLTDIWDLADATPTSQVWVAPTDARVHAVKSTSGEDDAGGTGAASLIVYGLTDWDTDEVNETVTLDGTANVNTANAYVIIHRMKCVGQASTTGPGVNIGTITATAASDATVTAAILPANGQTEMAIYGVPSTKTALVHEWRAHIDKSQGAAASADFLLKANQQPDVQLLGFLRKDDISVQSTGASHGRNVHKFPIKLVGPCIIKVQGIATTADTDGEAGFILELVDN